MSGSHATLKRLVALKLQYAEQAFSACQTARNACHDALRATQGVIAEIDSSDAEFAAVKLSTTSGYLHEVLRKRAALQAELASLDQRLHDERERFKRALDSADRVEGLF